MPLEHGLGSVNSLHLPRIRTSAWPLLLAHRNSIVTFFRTEADLLDKPYPFSSKTVVSNGVRTTNMEYCDQMPSKPLADLLEQIGNPSIFNDALIAFPDWERIGQFISSKSLHINDLIYAKQYALVDLIIVFIMLMNHYVADQSQIQSCYNNFVVVDALGRSIETRAVKEIEKIIYRRSGYISTYEIARCLIEIVKADLASVSARVENDGRAFEMQCCGILNAEHYHVEKTPVTGDFGADLIATKYGLRFAIQCKDTLRPVGIKAVQEGVGARAHYGADFAVICSSGGFTEAAMSLAATTGAITCNAVNLVRCLEAI